MRKTVYSLVAILLVCGLAAAGWFFYDKKNAGNQRAEEKVEPAVKQIVSGAVLYPHPAEDGKSVWYFNEKGRLLRTSVDGETTEFPLPSQNGNIVSVKWPQASQTGFLALVSQLGKNRWYYFDSGLGSFRALPSQVVDVSWLSNGRQIALVWKSGDGKSQQLVVSQPDGSAYKMLGGLPSADYEIYPSPQDDSALLVSKDSEGGNFSIYRYSLSDNSSEKLEAKGNYALWLPDGHRFVYAEQGALKLYSLADKTGKALELRAGRGKIAVDPAGRMLFAAVAASGERKGEKVVKVNLDSLAQTDVVEPETELWLDNAVVSGGRLFFSDPMREGLYQIFPL